MIILIGAGGNAIDAVEFKFKNESIQFIDDFKTGKFFNCSIIGTVNDLIEHKIKDLTYGSMYNCVGSVGNNKNRNKTYKHITEAGYTIQSLILSDKISGKVYIGENVLINKGAQIHHDCTIEDNCVIGPGAIICGNVRLRDNCYIGAGAIVKQGLTIGKDAVIGMGAVVLKNVPDGETWVGNPARRIKNV